MTSQMTVHVEDTDAHRIAARIVTPLGKEAVVTTASNYELDHSATPWLPPMLVAGMRKKWSIAFDGPVDSTALRGAPEAQKVLLDWYPRRFHGISVSAEPSDALSDGRGVGCFFSGGVDSFYSAITESDRITHLIFVHGFDISAGNEELAGRALASARDAAAELGKPLIEVKTTLRSAFGDRLPLDWGYDLHGAALAHVGLALSQHVSTVMIPSSNSRWDLLPWGSHPDLDPLWSSSSVTFDHHELEVDRLGKLRRIGLDETAMKHLRVCWENRDGRFNCGVCFKCIRTKIGLAAAGAESEALPGPIDLHAVRSLTLTNRQCHHLRNGLAAMEEAGVTDDGVVAAVDTAIRRRHWRQAASYLRRARSISTDFIRRRVS
ncbi:hypothetical protein [Rhodococcus sp. 05-2255-1e]|uniref:hypothetical protein n=1 Tax=Rhodococcus sp. 05-2255-1e TaxID=2022495 RepID=UPI0015C5ED9D|nr:hypothetical protein [Rhodococcus sp. 05-2255-1e]